MFIEKNGFTYHVPETDDQNALSKQLDVIYDEPVFVDRSGLSFKKAYAREHEPVNGLIRRLPEHVFGRRKGHGAFPNSRLSAR